MPSSKKIFTLKCPHCNEEFTLTVDKSKIKNAAEEIIISCSLCGKDAKYLLPINDEVIVIRGKF